MEVVSKDPGVWLEENLHTADTFSGPPSTTSETESQSLTPFPFTFATDICEPLDADDFVEDLLITNSLSVLYGESNCGKSFFAADLSCHVATGKPWMGREVERCGVVYAVLEGGAGMNNRLIAWKNLHGIEEVPVAVVKTSFSLHDPNETSRFQVTIEEASKYVEEKFGVEVRMVVIDTLARAMPGGNENAAEDMGRVVAAADMLREATNAHVMLVHHTGKDRARGARGHYSLTCAVDTEIEVSSTNHEGISKVRVTKQRDLERCPKFCFRLEKVKLGENRRGKPITSCNVFRVDSKLGKDRPKGQAGKALDILKDLIDKEGRNPPAGRGEVPPGTPYVTKDQWKEECLSKGLSVSDDTRAQNQAFSRAYDRLVPGFVGIAGDFVWVK